ncbi:hypothetical protein [Bacteroides ovatus]|uniref:hypothetical protein n=1 Tax=Bacteroides ovatus TaxID=28116 RepID=UPI0022E4FF67|nr:hypothetical protein [Bacteroides ovatus]
MQIVKIAIYLFILNGISILQPIYAQEHWSKEDSIKLTKMLDGEIPIHINENFKIEFEKSILGYPKIEDNDQWKKYINFKQPLKGLLLSPINNDILANRLLQNYNRKNNSLFFINSQIINISEYSNMSIPLTKKIHFNIYGINEVSARKSIAHPVSFFPYEFGAGVSYDINRHLRIGTQSNYQYNSIQKKWGWFMGLGITVVF